MISENSNNRLTRERSIRTIALNDEYDNESNDDMTLDWQKYDDDRLTSNDAIWWRYIDKW